MNPLEIINFLLLIFLFYVLIVLLYQLYQNQTEPTRFILPEFEDSFEENSEDKVKEMFLKNAELKLTTPDTFHGFVQLRVLSSKPFEIDWGNGLRSCHLSSTIPQSFPPVCYAPGKYQIIILTDRDSVMTVYYCSTYPQLQTVDRIGFRVSPEFIDESISCSNSVKNQSNTLTN